MIGRAPHRAGSGHAVQRLGLDTVEVDPLVATATVARPQRPYPGAPAYFDDEIGAAVGAGFAIADALLVGGVLWLTGSESPMVFPAGESL